MAIVSHTGYNMFVRTDCDYPWLFNCITFYYTWSMLFLFLHFYYTTYVASKRRRALQKVSEPSMTSAGKEISPEAAARAEWESKSGTYMNGYIVDGPSGYSLRSRKNDSVNGNASPLMENSL